MSLILLLKIKDYYQEKPSQMALFNIFSDAAHVAG